MCDLAADYTAQAEIQDWKSRSCTPVGPGPSLWMALRVPSIDAKCRSVGIDMTVDKIPVLPAAHYSCGGVAVDGWSCTSMVRLRGGGGKVHRTAWSQPPGQHLVAQWVQHHPAQR